MLSDHQLLRYSRQIMLSSIDVDGQEKLLAAQVLIVGLGGLGSPVALYLAAAGIGHLYLADFDQVDLTNLQRQIAHTEKNLGKNKVDSAAEKIADINSEIKITTITEALTPENLHEWIKKIDVVVDCSDNFNTRLAINAACVALKKPLVSGAAIRLEGQVIVFDARDSESPCYQCLVGEIDEQDLSCANNGVLAPLVGVIGSLQALETIKILTGFGKPSVGQLKIFDGINSQWREFKLAKDSQCKICQCK